MKRVGWIDIARAIGMLMIIMGHSLYVYTYSPVAKIIFAVHVPIFFVLSGYLFREKNFKDQFRNLAKNLLLPYLFTAFLIVGISGFSKKISTFFILKSITSVKQTMIAAMYGIGSPGQWGETPIPAIGVIWFLLALFVAEIIFNISVKVSKKFVRFKFSFLILISFILCTMGFEVAKYVTLPWSISAALVAQLFLCFGYILKEKNMLDRRTSVVFLFSLLFWGLSAKSGFFYLNVPIAANPVLAILGGMGGSIVIIDISKLIDKIFKKINLIKKFGKYSLIVMCVHVVDLSVLNLGNRIFEISQSNGAVIAIVFVVIYRVLITYLSIIFIPYIPLVRSVYMNRKYPINITHMHTSKH